MNNKYFLPLESTLYIRRGVNKIKNAEGENWSHDFIIETNQRNPNDVFIIPEENREKQNRKPERRPRPKPQRQGKEFPKIRLFINTYQLKPVEQFLDKCKKFSRFCQKNKITVFGMIYGLTGDRDRNTG